MTDNWLAKYFTMGYRQFMAYTRNIKYITIDIFKANAIHVYFDISSISSIGFVLIQTFIGHIKFHIVKTNTLFFFYLIDIDCIDV